MFPTFLIRCQEHSVELFENIVKIVFQSSKRSLNSFLYFLYFILNVYVIYIQEPFCMRKAIDILLSHTLQPIHKFSLKNRHFVVALKTVTVSLCNYRCTSLIFLRILVKYVNLHTQFSSRSTMVATSARNSINI